MHRDQAFNLLLTGMVDEIYHIDRWNIIIRSENPKAPIYYQEQEYTGKTFARDNWGIL